MKTNYNARKRKYFLVYALFAVMFMSLFVVVCLNTRNAVEVAIAWFAFFIVLKVGKLVIQKNLILSVLFKELDADAFENIVNDKRMVSSLLYRINAAINMGDYQTVINIANCQIHNAKLQVKVRFFYLNALARAYFELRDYEKLQDLVVKYEELTGQYPTKAFLRTPNSLWIYYRHFLNRDYEACKTVCEERNSAVKPRSFYEKFQRVQNDFCYAVACYENSETDAALNVFESVASRAPLMNFAKLAQIYIQSIKQNQPPLLSNTEILPGDSFQVYNEKTKNRMKRHKTIMAVGIIVILISCAMSVHFENKDRAHDDTYDTELSLYESELMNALTRKYGEITNFGYFSVQKDQKHVDALCVVNVNNELILVEVIIRNSDPILDVLEIAKSISIDTYYCKQSPLSRYYIGFQVTHDKPSADFIYDSFKFEFNNRTVWFCVDYLSLDPKS